MTRYIKCGFVRQTIKKERLIGNLLFLIVMCSGAVSTAMAGVHVKGNVYGGGNKASVGQTGKSTTAAVNIINTNTKVDGEVYGGCNSEGSVIGKAIVTIKSGTVGKAPGEGEPIKNVVFGGGKGQPTLIEGDVEVNIGAVGQSQTPATINGSVYGGSALGNVNAYMAGSPAVVTPVSGAKTDVNIIFGTVLGDVYGGGLGDKASLGDGHADVAANVYGAVTVNVGATDGAATPTYSGSATLQSSVYGCNNLNGSPKDDVTVNVYQTAHTPTNLATYTANDATYAIDQVFGGGNQAHYAPTDVINKRALVHIFTCANTVKTVYGGGNAADATKVGIIIDGGRFDRVFGGGNGFSETGNHTDPDAANYNPGANISGSATTQVHGGYYNKVFGGSNQFGDVANASLSLDTESSCKELFVSESFGGANEAVITGNVTTTLTCNSATGSFSIGSFYGGSNLANITGDVTLNVEGGTYINVFGGSKGAAGKAANIDGNVTLNLFGGTMDNAFGGCDVNGDITGKITVNMLNRGGDCPLFVHNIYGGGRDAAYTPTYTVGEGELHISPEVNLIHGTVSKKGDGTGGNVFGGGLGATAIVSANTKVTVGYNTSMAALVTSLLPDATSLTTANVVVQGDVYGGGEQAAVTGNTDVTVQQGTAEGMTISTAVNGAVYGGGALANVGTDASNSTQVTVTGGTVSDVYGGGLGRAAVAAVADDPETPDVDESAAAVEGIAALVNGAVTVNINGGSVTNVFGCNNINGAPQSTVQVNIEQTAATMSVTDVFGGGNLAQYAGSPVVNIKKGTVSGNVYGGGNGDPEDATQLKGATAAPTVTVGDLANGAYQAIVSGDVYGGGNAAKVTGETAPTVVVQKCNTQVGYVYGGGNAADVPATNVTISGGTIAHDVYGGGHGDKASLNVDENDHTHSDKAANVTGNVSVSVTGGTIDKVFAGSNLNGSIGGSVTLGIDKSTEDGACDMKIAEVYGGGNQAAGNAGTITIGCTGIWTEDDNDNDENNNFHNKHNTTDNRIGYELEGIGTVYGGANQANIGTAEDPSNIVLNITGGIVENAFGGNNTSGGINGSITVNVEWGSAACDNYIGNVFGGGNLAPYTGSPAVNILNGTVSQNVYGGGKGATAIVTGNPEVTIGDANASHSAIVGGDVYGGGDAAGVTGSTTVTYNDNNASSTVGRLFGGGNAAGVSSAATVTLTSGKVTSGVYGGCNASGSVGDVTIALNGGIVGATGSGNKADVYGGGLGAATTTTGNIGVTLNGTTVYGDLYGGSALGSVNASTSNTATLTISSNTLHGSIYGGGKGDHTSLGGGHSNVTATSNGNVIINYSTAISDLAGLYGGANINGLVSGNITVNVLANVGAAGDGNSLDIFGGGLGEETATGGNVTVNVGDLALDGSGNPVIAPVIYGAIYGGSALGQVNDAVTDVTTVNILSGTLHGNVYGGGLGEAGVANVAKGQVNGSVIVNIGTGTVDGTTGFATSTTGYATIDGSVYGCNNTNGSPKGDVTVNIYKTAHTTEDAVGYTGPSTPTYAIGNVFGGGRNADYSPVLDEGGGTTSSKRATVHVYGCDNTIEDVFGGGDAAAAYGVKTIIDGGRFDRVFGGGNGEVTAADIGLGGTDLRVHGGKVTQLFGGSNTQGTIIGNMGISVDATGACASDMYVDEFFCGNNLANIGTSENPVNIDATIGCGTSFGDIYGGCNLADIYGNVTLTIEGGIMNNVYGGSKGRVADNSDPSNPIAAEDADITGNVTLNIYGGNIRENAYGGSNVNGNITGSITVNMDWSRASSDCNSESDLHVGNIYGGSNLAAYTPTYTVGEGETRISPAVNIKHGTVSQSVFGGGWGASAIVTSNPVVTIGDDVEEHSAIVVGNVYGGGDAAAVTGNATVIYNDNNASSTVANLFGGGNAAGVSGTTAVTMTSGKVTAGIYGGCNASGSVGDATLAINGGTLGTSDTPLTSGIFGGGFGNNTTTTGNITVNVNGATVYGDVYGGSALGSVNASDANTTTVTLDAGTIHGGLYGGGLGNATYAATVNGGVTVTVNNGSADNVFGCNNINGAPQRTVAVNIAGGNVGDAYGGGNAAAYTGSPAVSVTGGTAGNVFGGGLGSTATVTGNPSVGISGGTVTSNVYGGGSEAQVAGSTSVTISGGTVNNNVFGGGNLAVVTKSVSVSITGGTVMNDVYGGGALADTNTENWDTSGSTWAAGKTSSSNTTTVILTGGTVGNVYGGALGQHAVGTVGDPGYTAAIEPKVYGDITVTINNGDGTGTARFMRAYETHDYEGTYKDANNEEHTQITTGNVYTKGCVFGANNKEGTPKGDIHVTINSTTPDEGKTHKYGTYEIQNVYGGGNLSAYEPAAGKATHVDIHGCDRTSIQFVFGGGNAAAVPETNVTIYGDYEIETVFGGGNGSEPYWSRTEEKWIECPGASVGTSNVTLKGGYIHSAFGGSYERGTVEHINLDKSGTGGECKLRVTDVFGGGKDADVTEDINITISDCAGFGGLVDDNPDITEIKNVYAGSYNARIFGSITMTVTSGVFTNVFGGNHTSGFINGPITINIEETEKCEPIIIDNLFGGGNYAAYPGLGANNPDPKITINVKAATRIGNIYGGSNRADVDADTEININMIKGWWAGRTYTSDEESLTIPSAIGTIGNIYGGGNEGNVDGNTIVNIGTQAEIELISTPQADSETGAVPAHMVPKANGKYDVLGANIIGDVFGGCNKGVVSGNTEVNICAVKGAEILAGDPPAGTGKYEYSPISSTVASGVTIAGSADYRGVFGGGKEGDVESDSYVRLYGGSVNQSVYGGGCDADVKGDTYVTMAGGYVYDGVYGGGLHGSVGTFTRDDTDHASHEGCVGGKPDVFTANTGTCTVIVSGGHVGPDAAAADGMNAAEIVDVGFVFGAGRGEVENPAEDKDADFHCYVNNTKVTIKNTYETGYEGGAADSLSHIVRQPLIMASVYGGGENGRVRNNTLVQIYGGQIGCGDGASGAYDETQWIDPTSADFIASPGSYALNECSHWPYGRDTNSDGVNDTYETYDPYADDAPTLYPGGSSAHPSDGKTYYGCVFGGGSGYYPYVKATSGTGESATVTDYDWLPSAGLVEGNTEVQITGGHILTNVYGGNEYTDVLGSCTVRMSGGTLGVPRTLEQIARHPLTCYLFGAGKGDPRIHFNGMNNVNSALVEVSGGIIYGSVFGGAEDGHVQGNVTVNIKPGAKIGTWGTSYVDGNVFGGGRGFSGENLVAGNVGGNITINITGGDMLGSVYGGGRLGSVGLNTSTGEMQEGDDHGHVTVNISGGTIGNNHEFKYYASASDPTSLLSKTDMTNDTGRGYWMLNHTKGGNVFAGAMGRREKLGSETAPITVLDWHKLGNVKSTKLTISGDDTWIKGNAYGGGEFGAVTGSHTTEGQQYGTEVLVQGGTIGTVIGDNINATTFSTGVGSGDTRYSFGAVYGGGYGTEADVISSADPYTTNVEKFGAYVNSNTYVSVSDASAKVRGSVYGGGEKAAVIGNTNVNISNGTIGVGEVRAATTAQGKKDYVLFGGWRMGNVFGGGKGSTNAVFSGLVKCNSNVTISGGHVYHNVYGGGAFASVGTYTLHTAESIEEYGLEDYAPIGSPASCASGTGTATIKITGGQIGINGWDNGMVDGSGRGDVSQPVNQGDGHSFDPYDRLAWVNNSIVTVGNAGSETVYAAPQPQIKGSVYGGGENGHNFGTAIVNILSGTIGTDAFATYDNGNVYGAGCGTDTYTGDDSQEHHNRSAGYVQGSGAAFGAQLNISGGHVIGSVFGGGSMASAGVKSILNISGGQIDGSAYGGPRGDMNDTELVARAKSTQVNISGGTINGSAFGGGLAGVVEQNVEIAMTGGTVKTNVYGGGAYADTNVLNIANYNEGGTTPSSTSTYTTLVRLTGGTIGYGANGGDAYGGALGRNAKVPIGTAGQHGYVPAVVDPKVYGDILLDLNGTTISDEEGTNIETTSRGCVLRRVFGCNDENGTPKGKVKVHVYATQPAATGTTIKKADKTTLFGKIADYTIANYSTYKFNEKTLSDLATEVGADVSAYTAILSGSGTADVKKAALADMIDAISQKKYDVLAVYGGGNLAMYEPVGAISSNADEKNAARSEVRIYGCDLTSIYQVYGGGNAAPTPGTYVRVNAAYEIGEVFGGGNGKDDFDLHGKYYKNPGANVGYVALAYFDDDDSPSSGTGTLGDPYQPIDKPNSTTKEGRQDPANNYMYGSGQATTEIVGGRIHKAYGGSNEKGNICTVAMSSYEEAGTCTLLIDETYGAGKNAPIDGMVSLELECVEYMAAIYGGSTNSNVNNDIVLNITNGTFGKVFGGNNTSGNVNGSITVNIQEKGCKPIRIGELYGGGYLADYSIYGYKANGAARTKAEYDLMSASDKAAEGISNPRRNPRVNVISATWIGEIYGGGYQAKVVGSPTVNVNMEKGQINSKFVAGNYTVGTEEVTDQLGTYSLNVERIISEVGDDKGNAELSIGTIGTIYGGGNEADIDGSTTVKIGTGKWRDLTTTDAADETVITRRAAFITESVFGGGNNGDVTGNSAVEIGNGYVADRIYGGGKLGNVGTISSRVTLPSGHSSHADCLGGGVPTAFAANTGKCTVTVTGGRVGPFAYSAGVVTPQEMSMTRVGGPDDYGYVFGAGRGAVTDPATDPDIDYKTFVDNTEVIVKEGYVAGHEGEAAYVTKPLIAGGVYGGSENGRVLHDTKVYIQGGQIGIGEGMTDAFNAGSRASEAYTDEEWAYDVTADTTKYLAECAHWPYGIDTNDDGKKDTFAPYDPNAHDDGYYYVGDTKPANAKSAEGGMPTGSDGHTFYGNVFGGGSGYFPYVDSNGQSQWLETAGEVKGNTYLTITGGHILTSIYGGNEMTNVLGNSYVTMVGGTLGVPRKLSQIDKHPVTCYLFGGGKGDPRIFFNEQTNVANAIVHISDDAKIFGSVFGGGEDGHVLGDVKMSIGSSTLPTAVASDPVLSALTLTGKKTVGGKEYPYIGTWGTSYVEGNVFGGGRGFSGEALTAGSVGGNVELAISGGTMLGSIYGGGRMAAVGINFTLPTLSNGDPNPYYGLLKDDTGAATYGHVTVNISGGTIGNDLEFEPVPRSITTKDALTTWKATNHIPNTDFYLGKDDNDADLYLLRHTKGGNVFGGSMGRNTHLDGTVNALWPKLAVVKLTEVTISDNANIKGNVYGGGELGVVRNMATVNVEGGTIQGDVYGGGYGSDDDSAGSEVTITAGGYDEIPTTYYKFTPMIWNGCVSGNTYVNVSGGWVKKSVYGGGEMASVGLINFNVDDPDDPDADSEYNYITKHDDLSNSFALSWPYAFQYIAAAPLDAASVDGGAVGGKATVNVTGGRIGITGKDYTGPATIGGAAASEDEMKARRTDNGDIYGGSKGIPENDRYRTAFSANVKETEVTINYASSNGAIPQNYKTGVSASTKSADEYDCIAGSVYGGGEDGHVMEDSRVTLTNGLIGHAIYGGGKGKTEFATKLVKIGATKVSGDGNSISDYDPSDTYDANVYGFISGRVLGNTHVSMSGGYVVRNIYGGGNMASVGKGNYAGGPDDYFTLGYGELTGEENLWDGVDDNSQAFLGSGKTNVTVTGGQVGYIDSDPAKSVKDGLPYGNIFGGCRGESAPNINAIPPFLYTPTFYVGYANETDVTIGTSGSSAGPRIYGSVYGGGQDGHVRRDSYVKVYSGEIGIPYTEANRSLVGTSSLPLSEELDNQQWIHRGNVYGSGSGIGKFKYDFNYDGDTDDDGEQDYGQSAGSVTRFTQVDVFGGTIHRNVYGGGSQASVGPPPNGSYDAYRKGDTEEGHGPGKQSQATVNISGTVGSPTGYNVVYGGEVYGASRGNIALPVTFSTSVWTNVHIKNGAVVKGNVYGGGDAGAVLKDTNVEIGGE